MPFTRCKIPIIKASIGFSSQALREELQKQRGSSVGSTSAGAVEDAERIKTLEDELERFEIATVLHLISPSKLR